MGSLKSPSRTSCRLSIETIALNCWAFEKIAFLCTHFGDRQTDGQKDKRQNVSGFIKRSFCSTLHARRSANRWQVHRVKLQFAIASGGLITYKLFKSQTRFVAISLYTVSKNGTTRINMT